METLNNGTLYVVGTPIGNLNDITDRAKEVLSKADLVLCEDTRVTKKLLSAFDIEAATESLHEHTDDAKLSRLAKDLAKGKSYALVSDAGTPAISDPGGKFVKLAVELGVNVVPIPGASAVTTALSVSGFPANTFTFFGFPPHKKGRKTFFAQMENIASTVVFYESKHRIEKTLDELPQDRAMMVGRELTKMHETLYRGTAPEIKEQILSTSLKGEFVMVLAPKGWKL
jgi:16S rRNA (cytidine1402-2'-O)-methyltransferase